MLAHLTIDNVAVAQHLDIEFSHGMTVVTGETGAGKSIMLDALGLALGDRADAAVVRRGARRAEIHATFDIAGIPAARRWLEQRDLLQDNECLLRRSIGAEGRSRGYINGHPATLQDLKTLGGLLLDIHSQHAHQSLLQKSQQRRLLDEFAGLTDSAAAVARLAEHWHSLQQRIHSLRADRSEQSARSQLLNYQIGELHALDLQGDEIADLEREQKQLSGGEHIIQSTQTALALCREGELNVTSILQQALKSLETIDGKSRPLDEAEQLLNSALIQVEEASGELQHHIDHFELDPRRLAEVQQRLSDIYEVARKHRIKPEQLPQLQQELEAELAAIDGTDESLAELEAEREEIGKRYRTAAERLSKKRRAAAKKLTKRVEEQLAALSMANCRFDVQLAARDDGEPHPHGAESAEFAISTNPGSALQPLGKIASGGELSRISLAIQVVTAQTSATPTLVFDEVDVGIGGATAEVVGNLLRQLGDQGQVLCVTHQPQVASKGHRHLLVEKQTDRQSTRTRVTALTDEEKTEEIARMLGGIDITEHSRAHAREMLTTD